MLIKVNLVVCEERGGVHDVSCYYRVNSNKQQR